jgi:hypothetical protein
MFSRNVKPWWERVNDYYLFDERQEFIRGAVSYQPNNRQEAMVAQLIAGYVPNKHPKPEAIGKRSERYSK